MKRIDELACCRFLYHDVMVLVPATHEGRIHACPHNLTEIAAPVSRDGVALGVLLGGQCWRGKSSAPCDDLIVPEDKSWLEDRRRLLLCVAAEIAHILVRPTPESTRSNRIQSLIHERHREGISIDELAEAIHLSPSRARHVVRECFGVSFTELVNAYRLARAAELLETTGLPVGDISGLVGFCDQAYMTRLFTRRYKMNPTAWRKRNAGGG